jgi:hypothetical protein
MFSIKTAVRMAALLLAVSPTVPAAAQTAKPAPTPTAPPAWTVSSDEARGAVEIAAVAKGGAALFVGGCSKFSAQPGLTGAFTRYRGAGLRIDGQVENVAFYARGEEWQDAFAVQLRYSAARQAWEFARPLSPVFLASFSRGATLAVVNGRNEEIFAFDLTGTTAAVRAMRTICEYAP